MTDLEYIQTPDYIVSVFINGQFTSFKELYHEADNKLDIFEFVRDFLSEDLQRQFATFIYRHQLSELPSFAKEWIFDEISEYEEK